MIVIELDSNTVKILTDTTPIKVTRWVSLIETKFSIIQILLSYYIYPLYTSSRNTILSREIKFITFKSPYWKVSKANQYQSRNVDKILLLQRFKLQIQIQKRKKVTVIIEVVFSKCLFFVIFLYINIILGCFKRFLRFNVMCLCSPTSQ